MRTLAVPVELLERINHYLCLQSPEDEAEYLDDKEALRALLAAPGVEDIQCHQGCGNPAGFYATWPFNGQTLPYCQGCLDYYEEQAQREDDHNAWAVAQGAMDGGSCPRPILEPIKPSLQTPAPEER